MPQMLSKTLNSLLLDQAYHFRQCRQPSAEGQSPPEEPLPARVGAVSLAGNGPLRLVFLQGEQASSQEYSSVILEVKAEQGSTASVTLSTLFTFPRCIALIQDLLHMPLYAQVCWTPES